jgi:hypothetical protein
MVASLCINDGTNVRINRSATWSGASLKIHNAEIVSVVSSDNEIMPKTRVMRLLCDGDECVRYKAHCDGSSVAYKCKIWYSFRDKMPLREIDINGNQFDVAEAKDRIRLVRSATVLIPLKVLKYDASDDLPPT